MTKSRPLLVLLLVVLLVPTSLAAPPAMPGQPPEPVPFSDRYPAEVTLDTPELATVLVHSGVDIDNIRPLLPGHTMPHSDGPFEPLVATVYVTPKEETRLEMTGLVVHPIPNYSHRAFLAYGPASGTPNAWPSYDDWVTRMQDIAAAHPDIVRMYSIGQSVQGRDIWVLEISDTPDTAEDEPEFKYSSTMHGDEPVGTEMLLRLAEYLTDNYGSDPTVTELVDEVEIWLCPLHNPDGYVAGSRYNANGYDLNREFPDRIDDPIDDPTGRPQEVQVFMNWGYAHHFVMGANYHTGALVVNYPWDSIFGTAEYAPDDETFAEWGANYARRNPAIKNGGFENGITRGWEWYIIHGGMQDWAYHWRGEHHVTIEISNTKWPAYDTMDDYWDDNRAAMLWWMQRVLCGARGLVTDALTGEPLAATITAAPIDGATQTDPQVGDYHRLLLPGTYTVTASATGYLSQTVTVTVGSGAATVHDFALDRIRQPIFLPLVQRGGE